MKRAMIGCLSGGGKFVTLTNTVTNGNFVNTTGWASGGDTFTVSSNEATFRANSQNDTLQQSATLANTNVYYFCGWVKADSSSVAIKVSDLVAYSDGASHSGGGNYEFLSFRYVATRNATGAIYIIDGRASAWTYNYIKYISMMNLTTAFGAGSEPTKAQMDGLMTQFSNSWLNGTQTAIYNW